MANIYSFKGRAPRRMFWLFFVLSNILNYYVATENISSISSMLSVLFSLFVLNFLWVYIAIIVKRCHDIDKSGWWVLLALIPIIGGIWAFIVLGFREGNPLPNKYGNPIARKQGVGNEPAIVINEPPIPVESNQSMSAIPDFPLTDEKPVQEKKPRIWLRVVLVNLGLIVLLFIIGIIIGQAANSTIIGVFTVNGDPEPDQPIWVINYDTGEKEQTLTADNGVYQFEYLKSGSYYIGTTYDLPADRTCSVNNPIFTTMILPTSENLILIIEIPDGHGFFIDQDETVRIDFDLICD